jgi:hypothetical protein
MIEAVWRVLYNHPFWKRKSPFVSTNQLLLFYWKANIDCLSVYTAHAYQQLMSQGRGWQSPTQPLYMTQYIDHYALRNREGASLLALPSLSYMLFLIWQCFSPGCHPTSIRRHHSQQTLKSEEEVTFSQTIWYILSQRWKLPFTAKGYHPFMSHITLNLWGQLTNKTF